MIVLLVKESLILELSKFLFADSHECIYSRMGLINPVYQKKLIIIKAQSQGGQNSDKLGRRTCMFCSSIKNEQKMRLSRLHKLPTSIEVDLKDGRSITTSETALCYSLAAAISFQPDQEACLFANDRIQIILCLDCFRSSLMNQNFLISAIFLSVNSRTPCLAVYFLYTFLYIIFILPPLSFKK